MQSVVTDVKEKIEGKTREASEYRRTSVAPFNPKILMPFCHYLDKTTSASFFLLYVTGTCVKSGLKSMKWLTASTRRRILRILESLFCDQTLGNAIKEEAKFSIYIIDI